MNKLLKILSFFILSAVCVHAEIDENTTTKSGAWRIENGTNYALEFFENNEPLTNKYTVTNTTYSNFTNLQTQITDVTNQLYTTQTNLQTQINTKAATNSSDYISISMTMTAYVHVVSSTNWLSYDKTARVLYGCYTNQGGGSFDTNISFSMADNTTGAFAKVIIRQALFMTNINSSEEPVNVEAMIDASSDDSIYGRKNGEWVLAGTDWSKFIALQDLDMGGFSITNLSSTSLKFDDGTILSSGVVSNIINITNIIENTISNSTYITNMYTDLDTGPIMTNAEEVSIGKTASGIQYGSVAIGKTSQSSAAGVAIGSGASGLNIGSAVGQKANGDNGGVAIGNRANGDGGVAVGPSSIGGDDGVAIGDLTKGNLQGVAIGYFADGSNNAVAVGAYSKATNDSVALGFGVTNTIENSTRIKGDLNMDTNSIILGGEARTNWLSTNICAFNYVGDSIQESINSVSTNLSFPTKVYDYGNNFDGMNFIAPVNGVYLFNIYWRWSRTTGEGLYMFLYDSANSVSGLLKPWGATVASGPRSMDTFQLRLTNNQSIYFYVASAAGFSNNVPADHEIFGTLIQQLP